MIEYEPQRIQPKRRTLQIRKEEKFESIKFRESKKTKVAKPRVFKAKCEECGLIFQSGTQRRFCNSICKQEFIQKNRETKIKITREKISFSTGYEIKLMPSLINQWILFEYKRDIKSFPDWSSIAKSEIQLNRKAIKRQSLTKEQRSKLDAIKHASRNKEIRRKWERDYVARRKKEDPEYRLRMTMRSRFAKFKRGYNLKSISHLLGCSHQELRSHLESKMDRKMSWDNYGSYWHIDHILPCASFDHNDPKQVEQCWHWTNLQPMRAKDNLKKGFSITNPQMNLTI